MKVDFTIHDSLNPKFWNGFTLKKNVRKKLVETALEFHKFLKIKAKIKDVIITGSSSNFNYSPKYSDVDLHILYEFDDVLAEVDDGEVIKTEDELVEEYLNAKKSLWNDNYDISIKGTNVELYAQDVDAKHVASGTFSLIKNSWLKKPEKTDVELDLETAVDKAKDLMHQIDHVIDSKLDSKKLKEKLFKFRQSGLESKEGEFSPENLAFKILRRTDYIEKLHDYAVEKTVDSLSIK